MAPRSLFLLLAASICLGQAIGTERKPSEKAAVVSANNTVPQSSAAKRTGPFGFEYGMTAQQLTAAVGRSAIVEIKGDLYKVKTAPRPHPLFEYYLLVISPERGLLKISAISKDIETSIYGEELKNKFDEIQSGVSNTYGSAEKMDYLREGSIWKESEDWTMGLLKKERVLIAFWKEPKNKIQIIALEANGLSRNSGYLRLSNEFEGWDEYVDAQKAKKDQVF